MNAVQQKRIGILLAVFGVVLFSSKAILVKLAYGYGVDSVSLLLFRMLFAMPVYIILLLFSKPQKKLQLQQKEWLWLVFFWFCGLLYGELFRFSRIAIY